MKEEKHNIYFEEVVSNTRLQAKIDGQKKIDKDKYNFFYRYFSSLIISYLVVIIDFYYPIPTFIFIALLILLTYNLYKAIKTPPIFL